MLPHVPSSRFRLGQGELADFDPAGVEMVLEP
jgi:hypothetical protein